MCWCVVVVVILQRVIKSLGLSIKDFNIIMRRIQHDPELKRRVLDQAQLYRIESRINERLLCTVAVDDDEVVVGGSGTKVASILDEDFNTPLASNFRRPPRKLELFAKSLKEIEALRIEHAQQVTTTTTSSTTSPHDKWFACKGRSNKRHT